MLASFRFSVRSPIHKFRRTFLYKTNIHREHVLKTVFHPRLHAQARKVICTGAQSHMPRHAKPHAQSHMHRRAKPHARARNVIYLATCKAICTSAQRHMHKRAKPRAKPYAQVHKPICTGAQSLRHRRTKPNAKPNTQAPKAISGLR